MYWQGWARANGSREDTVLCRTGREGLYDDWCGRIITFDFNGPVDEHGPLFCEHQLRPDTVYRQPLRGQAFLRHKREVDPDSFAIIHRWTPGRNHFKDKAMDWYAPVFEWAVQNGKKVHVLDSNMTVKQSMSTLLRCAASAGPEGGGQKLALLTKTPIVTWGIEREKARLDDENVWGAKIIYLDWRKIQPADIIKNFSQFALER